MPVFRRYLVTFFLGLFVLMTLLLGTGRLALALKPDDAQRSALGSDVSAPTLAAFNLGDCLREADRRNWPPAYASICADLNAVQIDEPPAPPAAREVPTTPKEKQSTLPSPAPRAAKVETASRPEMKLARADFIPPVPVARPIKKAGPAPAEQQAIALAIPAVPTCMIDEHGGTINLDSKRRKLPPQIVSQKAKGRAEGVALLVPAACGVKSPMKAKVLYAGDFKGYRGVVILGLPSKHRLIVAGLDAVRVKRGDAVERGAMLGTTLPMGAPALATAFNANLNRERSLLFFDLRNAKGASKEVYWLVEAS